MESLTGKTSEEVEVLKLAENGRNWKIYRAKIIKAAATDITDLLGVLAGWEPDNGSYDWECWDAILKWTFYTSVPISILCPIRKLNTADQIFKYLAKRFRDSKPIPHANEFQCAGTAAAAETPEKSPTSADAATERHVSAERNNEDLSTTKALTRGTEDVDNGNVGRNQDPCMSSEDSAKGTSAKCAETTTVVLESAPHKMQNRLQNSLPLTPRLPIEGEPSGCKQEAADSVVMAGRTNRMVRMAEPTEIADINLEKAAPDGEPVERAHRIDEGDETDADVDRMALLGREPAEMACRVDKGDGMEHRDLRLQQTNSYCKESRQHNEITNENVPSTYGLPLEGEWTVFASGEARDPKGDANASDAATEHAYHPSESRMTEDANGVELEGCREGASESASIDVAAAECCQQLVGMADSDPSQGVEPAEMSNVSKTLITMSVELEDLCSGGILRVCLGNRADGSRDHTDVSSGQTDAPSVKTDADRPANKPENISIPRKREKPPNLPIETARGHPDKLNSCGNLVDTSSVRTDGHSDGDETETAVNETESIRKCRNSWTTRNLPITPEIKRSESTRRWRRVSVKDVDIYIPWNVPIEALGQTFEFGQAESGVEAIAPIVEGETVEGAGDCDGDRDGDDGSVDGTTSGSDIDSKQVEVVLLTGDSQHMRQI